VGYTDQKDLPLTWDGKTGENVLWKISLKGTTGHSSPIVWGDRVFLTTAAKQDRQQEEKKEVPEHHISCYQAADGKLLWSTPIPQGKEPAGYAIYAVPTPVTDGKAVYAWFGSAVIAALDFDGKLLWRHERGGPFNLNPGICSSPVLYEDTVILISDQGRGQSWLQGLDKKTGEVKWERKRPKETYCNTTPLLLAIGGKPQLIVAGSNTLQGLNPANGEPIWWCKSWGFGPSPAYDGGLLFVDKVNGEPGSAVDPTGAGDVTATHVKWKLDKVPAEYSSPVISGEYVYRAHKPEGVTCRKLATGEQVYTEPLKGISILASPFATADGRIYFASGDKSFVIKAGPKFELLATNDLRGGGGNGSSPAVANGRIFIRGSETFFCIGKK
jgi:outer membrane protein assembly factor BamB